MIKLIDKYFKYPVIYDYMIALVVFIVIKKIALYRYINLPKEESIINLSSEIVTILLTFSGFILTFLTVLITFKLDAGKPDLKPENEMSLLEKFSHSGLYYQTTQIFKNSIKSVVFASIIIYIARIIPFSKNLELLYLVSISGIVILILTIIRNLAILDEILKLQNEEK